MVTKPNIRRVWTKVEDLLTIYDGSLTEIFIVDLPIDLLRQAMSVAADELSEPVLRNVETAPGVWGDVPYREGVLDELEPFERIGLNGEFGPEEILQVYFELYEAEGVFVVEIVFGNRTSFAPEQRDDWLDILEAYIDLAQKLRLGHSDAKIVFSPEFNGNPRESIDQSFVTVLDL